MVLNYCGVITEIKLTEEERKEQEKSVKVLEKLIKENKLKF